MIQKLEKKLSGYKSNLKQISENYDKAVKINNNAMSNRLKGEMFILELVIDELEPIIITLKKELSTQKKNFQDCENLLDEAHNKMLDMENTDYEFTNKISEYFNC